MDGGGSSIRRRDRNVSLQFIAHTGKNRDVLSLPYEAIRLDWNPILNPNVLFVDNGGCVYRGDRRVSDETDYQQSYPEGYEFELRP
jgi:hypothetical protein